MLLRKVTAFAGENPKKEGPSGFSLPFSFSGCAGLGVSLPPFSSATSTGPPRSTPPLRSLLPLQLHAQSPDPVHSQQGEPHLIVRSYWVRVAVWPVVNVELQIQSQLTHLMKSLPYMGEVETEWEVVVYLELKSFVVALL